MRSWSPHRSVHFLSLFVWYQPVLYNLVWSIAMVLNLGDIASPPVGDRDTDGGRKHGEGQTGAIEQWPKISMYLCTWSVRIQWGQNSVGRISHGKTPPYIIPTPLFTGLKNIWLQSKRFSQAEIERPETTTVGDDRKKVENHCSMAICIITVSGNVWNCVIILELQGLYDRAYEFLRAGCSKHLSRFLRLHLWKSQLISEIRLFRRCKTANLSRVSRQALRFDLRRDSDSPSYIVWVTGF